MGRPVERDSRRVWVVEQGSCKYEPVERAAVGAGSRRCGPVAGVRAERGEKKTPGILLRGLDILCDEIA